MSTLYGIISHAALSKLLKHQQHRSFCECCTVGKNETNNKNNDNNNATNNSITTTNNNNNKKTTQKTRKRIVKKTPRTKKNRGATGCIGGSVDANVANKSSGGSRDDDDKFNKTLVNFLRDHHLSVYAVEKNIRIDNLGGRVDCIFLENRHHKTLYIVDWKFFRHVPNTLSMEYIIQLNLYMYMMKRLQEFSHFNFKLYCIIFSALDPNKIKVFDAMILPEEFLQTLTSIASFHS